MNDHRIRLRLERLEQDTLSPFAQLSHKTQGRRVPEEPSFMRTEYQRDRDRVIHSKAFRRLKHKTQVFIAPVSDHFSTRLSHTIEVAQIARSIARALRLNEDLTEAIALAHDLGHTPFGHLGEEFFDARIPSGYRHAEQSLRVVDILEKEGRGLNLTWEVRQGVVNHSKGRGSLRPIRRAEAEVTLEAEICRLSDAIAYVNHDIGDAIRAGVIDPDDIPVHVRRTLGSRHAERLNTIIADLVETSWAVTGEGESVGTDRPSIEMSQSVLQAVIDLREFLFENVYLVAAREQSEDPLNILETLWDALVNNPELIPEGYARPGDEPNRRAVDYISGMTDQFAARAAQDLRAGRVPEMPLAEVAL